MTLFPSIRRRLTVMTRTTKWVTMESTRVFLNDELKRIADKEDEEGMHMRNFIQERASNMTKGICRRTAYNWMVAAGMKYEEAKQMYYTDGYNCPDMIEYRNAYIDSMRKLALRQPLWTKTAERDEHGNVMGYKDLHVDSLHSDVYLDMRATFPMGGQLHQYFAEYAATAKAYCQHGHSLDRCKCDLPVWHEGQDESCYKYHSCFKRRWTMEGVQRLIKKREGC